MRAVVNHFRGLEVADLLFLDGLGLRDTADRFQAIVGETEAVSIQAVADWLKRYGPTSYLTVAPQGAGYMPEHIPCSAPCRPAAS